MPQQRNPELVSSTIGSTRPRHRLSGPTSACDWGHERRERIAEYRNRRIRQHGSAFPRTFDQQRFYFADTLTYSRSRHSIQMGGSLSRILDDVNIVGLGSLTQFLSWPDFLFGLNASQNGTNLFSNVFASVDDYGLLDPRI